MAQRFNRAMEIMGWRVPADSEEIYDETVAETGEPEEELREFTLQSYPGGQAEPEPVALHTPSVRRIVTVHPQGYADAPHIGESFRSGIPVIMNLTDLPDADARRLVDFAAGLVFGLEGVIERVTPRVFLLSPKNVEVTTDGRHGGDRLFS